MKLQIVKGDNDKFYVKRSRLSNLDTLLFGSCYMSRSVDINDSEVFWWSKARRDEYASLASQEEAEKLIKRFEEMRKAHKKRMAVKDTVVKEVTV